MICADLETLENSGHLVNNNTTKKKAKKAKKTKSRRKFKKKSKKYLDMINQATESKIASPAVNSSMQKFMAIEHDASTILHEDMSIDPFHYGRDDSFEQRFDKPFN